MKAAIRFLMVILRFVVRASVKLLVFAVSLMFILAKFVVSFTLMLFAIVMLASSTQRY